VAAILIESAAPYSLVGLMFLIPYARQSGTAIVFGQVWAKMTVSAFCDCLFWEGGPARLTRSALVHIAAADYSPRYIGYGMGQGYAGPHADGDADWGRDEFVRQGC
jgi:hypothetical protein